MQSFQSNKFLLQQQLMDKLNQQFNIITLLLALLFVFEYYLWLAFKTSHLRLQKIIEEQKVTRLFFLIEDTYFEPTINWGLF